MEFGKKKVAKTLGLLSKKDVNKFEQFLCSPYYVKPDSKDHFLRLFQYLKVNLSKNPDFQCEEEALFDIVFPNTPFVLGKIDKTLSRLTAYLLQFIGLEKLKTTQSVEMATLSVLQQKGVNDLWLNQYKATKKKFEQGRSKKQQDAFESFQLDMEWFRFQNQDPLKKNQQDYRVILDALDDLYQAYALEVGIQVLAYNKFIFPIELEGRFDSLKMMLSDESNLPKTGGDQIRRRVFHLLNNPESAQKENIEELVELLSTHRAEIFHSSYTNIRSIARNLSIHLYNLGDHTLERFIFNMYKDDVAEKNVFYDGKISAATVNNITTFALRQKEYDWLNDFLDKQQFNILETYIQPFTVALNRSKVLFFQGKYEKLLDTLKFEVKDVYLKVASRVLEVLTYYELKSDQLDYKIEAFKIFIYRLPKKKVSGKYIIGHNNFIDILKSICHPKTAFDEQRILKLKTKIIGTDLLAEKNWLLKKIEELEQNLPKKKKIRS